MSNWFVRMMQKQWFTWLALIALPPLGLVLLWKNKFYSKPVRIILTIIFSLYLLLWVYARYGQQGQNNQELSPELNQKTETILTDLNDYVFNNYSGKVDWGSYIKGVQGQIAKKWGKEYVTVTVLTTLTEKNGAEQEIANAIFGFFNEQAKTKYNYQSATVRVKSASGEILAEKTTDTEK